MNFSRKLLGMAAIFAAVPFLITAESFAQYEDPPARVARIAYLQGTVSLQPAGVDSWNNAPPNYPMISGDRIYTEQNSRAVIQNGSTDLRLWGQTDVTLTNLTNQYEQIGIAQGSIRVRVYGLGPGNTVEVDTPNAAIIIQHPGDYRVNAYNAQASLVVVNTGFAQVTGPGVNQEVDQGQAVQIDGANPIDLGLVEMPSFDDLDRWSIDRDHHILNSVSAHYVSHAIPGYDDLDDNGSWTVTPDYGPVWYPRVVDANWQPYTVGHWAYVRPWGYTWIDDAPWGYAPFHYGRWAVIGGRWGWAPGPPDIVPVYSPALVAFVGSRGGVSVGNNIGGGIGVAAWFPLGIAEPYVPWYRCTPNYVRTVNVTNINTTVIRNVTVVNNYNVFINNTRNVTNVNQISVTNVNYVNRPHVYAVSANALTSGTHVQQSAVRLNEQQRQQLVSAPVVVARPPAPSPPRTLLQPRPSVARPVARPGLMTPHGAAPATPAANKPNLRPVALPRPQPSTAIKPAVKPVSPNLKPAVPVANRPAVSSPNARPNIPPATASKPVPPEPNTKVAQPPAQSHPTTPAQPSHPAPPVNDTRRALQPEPQPTQPTPQLRPATPAQPTHPTPPVNHTQPAPQPELRPAQPTPQPHPTSITQPSHPAPPVNDTRRVLQPEPRPTQPIPPTKPPQPHPELQHARPVPETDAHPQAKTPPKNQKPEEKKKPNEEKKPEDEKKPE
jgi:hypothetical protein